MKTRFHVRVLTACITVTQCACSGDGNPTAANGPVSGTITTGADVPLVSVPVGTTGGIVGVSFAAPGGHCSVRRISAMWYFEERFQKLGKPRLYDSYDNYYHLLATEPDYRGSSSDWIPTPQIPEDDNRGYRLASAVQSENASHFDQVMRLLKESNWVGAK